MDPFPTEIRLRKVSRCLTMTFDDGNSYDLPFEYLRVYSPSAEVRGHGPGQERLQTGKEDVRITRIEPVGRYALKLVFDDGHSTGLYSFRYLQELGREYDARWADYLDRLATAGYARRSSDDELA